MKVQKTVVVDKPLDAVFGDLSDFTTTPTEWYLGHGGHRQPAGDGGVGTTYLNTSKFLGRETQLTYIVHDFLPGRRVQLYGENKTVIAVDTFLTFRTVGAATEVTYTAEFTFKGPSRLLAPLLQARLRPARHRGGDRHAQGTKSSLTNRGLLPLHANICLKARGWMIPPRSFRGAVPGAECSPRGRVHASVRCRQPVARLVRAHMDGTATLWWSMVGEGLRFDSVRGLREVFTFIRVHVHIWL